METTKPIKKRKKNEPDGFDRFNRISNTSNVILNIIFLIMSLTCIIPVLLVVAISFSAEQSITEYGYRFIPKIFSLEGYTFLANQSKMILRALGISLFVTIVGTVLGVMLTTLMGYVLSRPNYKLNGFLTMVVFIPIADRIGEDGRCEPADDLFTHRASDLSAGAGNDRPVFDICLLERLVSVHAVY